MAPHRADPENHKATQSIERKSGKSTGKTIPVKAKGNLNFEQRTEINFARNKCAPEATNDENDTTPPETIKRQCPSQKRKPPWKKPLKTDKSRRVFLKTHKRQPRRPRCLSKRRAKKRQIEPLKTILLKTPEPPSPGRNFESNFLPIHHVRKKGKTSKTTRLKN